jgi:hypothetical protein
MLAHVGRKASAFLGRGYKAPLSFPPEPLYTEFLDPQLRITHCPGRAAPGVVG